MKLKFWNRVAWGLACAIGLVHALLNSAGAIAEDVRRCKQPRQSARVERSPGLVIAPFAVPVAVPVAVVQQPTLLYRVREVAAVAHLAVTPEPEQVPEQKTATVEKLFEQRCAACHAAGDPRSNLAMFDVDGKLLKRLPRQLILEMVAGDGRQRAAMPPAPLEKLTQDEVESIRQWSRVSRRTIY